MQATATTTIHPNHVEPCDVILSYGSGTISDLVRLIDGGSYSHAALFDGEQIIEAGLSGVVSSSLQETLADQTYADVYRFQNDDKQGFSMPDWPWLPVAKKANQYLERGTQYANNQLYLLGILLVLRKKQTDPDKLKKYKTIVAMVFKLMKRIINGKEVKAVICSELVYRCFDEAATDGRYGLSIPDMLTFNQQQLFKSARSLQTSDPELNHQLQGIKDMLTRINPHLVSQQPSTGRSSNPLAAAELVSPYDLEHSENLVYMGRLTQ